MRRKKSFFTLLLLLFFISLVFFPIHSFASEEKTEGAGKSPTTEEKSKDRPETPVLKTKETAPDTRPRGESKDTPPAETTDKPQASEETPASKDQALPAKEESPADPKAPADETSRDKQGSPAEDPAVPSPMEDKEKADDGDLSSKDPETPGEDPAKDAEKAEEEPVKTEPEAKADPAESPQAGLDDKAPAKVDETANQKENPDVLEKGQVLEVKDLAKNPMVLGSKQNETVSAIVEVSSFKELKNAIANAGNNKTTIKIIKSFELTETITIGEDQDIVLTADNKKKADGKWKHVKQPADYADQGEEKQREIIEEARKRGQEALEKADLDKNPLPSEDKGDIIIKRAKNVWGSLFNILGKLTLGTKDTAIYIDGNKDVATALDNRGAVIDVNGTLVMKNAVVMNSVNHHGYTAPIRVNNGGTFTMEGGRISSNTSCEKIDAPSSRPSSAGAVYVNPGGSFLMKAGLIDNNEGGMTGGIFAGDLFGSTKDFARVTIEGGIIAGNQAISPYQYGAGICGFPKSLINITDGIIAGNKTDGTGGGIAVSDQFVYEYSNTIDGEEIKVSKDYKEFLKKNKAETNLNGGLLYKNEAYNGGGVFVDSNHVNFGKTMLLDNDATNWGGGIYVSFPPRTQELENILITENKAIFHSSQLGLGGGTGGGLWNCPTGYVHIGDGHSVYVFDNNSELSGKDITFLKKTSHCLLNGIRIEKEFYSHISPVTKDGNFIKFINDGSKDSNLSYDRYAQYLKAYYNDALKAEAWKNSKIFILGNTANNGGGLGSNANLETPGDEGDYKVEIHKKWDASVPNDKRPDKVKVDIFIVPLDKDTTYVKSCYGWDPLLYKYGEVEITAKNGWTGRFEENYFNGADKQEILNKLGIKSWADIGLPENAFSKDKGLPFTPEELAAKGYKYLFVEQGDDFLVKVEESKPQADKTVHAGVIEVERGFSGKWDTDKYAKRDQKIYFYLYDPIKKELTRFAETILTKNNN